MRVYLKRLSLLLTGGILVTFVLISLPSATFDDATRLPVSGIAHRLGYRHSALSSRVRHGNIPKTKSKSDGRKVFEEQDLPGVDIGGQLPPKQVDIGAHSSGDLSKEYRRVSRSIDKDLVALGRYVAEFEKDDTPHECSYNTTLEQHWREKGVRLPKADSWDEFHTQISSCQLYNDDQTITSLLNDLRTLKIKHVENMDGGTQIKLVITFENKKKAVFKPMRFGRDYQTDKNHFYFSDFERHNAEIATFHLDRVLGFHRAIPTVGRIVSIENELKKNADKALAKTFFWSPAKSMCFVGKCDYYCDTTHAICGSPDLKEGSMQVFLPDEKVASRSHNRSPYRRTYSKKKHKAVWQKDDKFCEWKVKNIKEFAHGRRLIDLIDIYILDFLIGNQDRHHFETFDVFDDHVTYPIHLDNGRAFGRPDIDDLDILKPLTQCCMIRPSTLQTLLTYYAGPISLTQALHRSMASDPVAPILAQKHYGPMERRLEKILRAVKHCIDTTGDWRLVLRNTYENTNVTSESQTSKDTEADTEREIENKAKKGAKEKAD